MRIIFCGTTAFSATILECLVAKQHDVPLVLTQPDRPAGRGLHLKQTPVKEKALSLGLEVMMPLTLKDNTLIEQIASLNPDVAVVVAYGLLLPKPFLDLPKLGCLNIHASLLPRWRGAAPIHRAIMTGDRMTGVSIMKMDEGLDTGPVYHMAPVPIDDIDTTGRLENKLLETAVVAIETTLKALSKNPCLEANAQNEAQSTYAAKIDKTETEIDWQASAKSIDCLIRGLQPTPGAKSTLKGHVLKITMATPLELASKTAAPGEIMSVDANQLIIACGKGALAIKEVQRANGKKMPIDAFLRGFPLQVGEGFETPLTL